MLQKVSVTMVVMATTMMMIVILLGTGVESAPAERDPRPSRLDKSLPPERSEPSPHRLSRHLKQWLLTAKPVGAERTTTKTAEEESPAAGPARRAQMSKMIRALEELNRTINRTRSARLTLLPRANGRNSGRKNKGGAVAEGGAKPTTVPPMETSSDIIDPSSLTGRNLKKSHPSQPKKTNKRVCFWKYCSQN